MTRNEKPETNKEVLLPASTLCPHKEKAKKPHSSTASNRPLKHVYVYTRLDRLIWAMSHLDPNRHVHITTKQCRIHQHAYAQTVTAAENERLRNVQTAGLDETQQDEGHPQLRRWSPPLLAVVRLQRWSGFNKPGRTYFIMAHMNACTKGTSMEEPTSLLASCSFTADMSMTLILHPKNLN